MRTLKIRKIPKAILSRLKAVARRKNHSMEQEVRELLGKKYAPAESSLFCDTGFCLVHKKRLMAPAINLPFDSFRVVD